MFRKENQSGVRRATRVGVAPPAPASAPIVTPGKEALPLDAGRYSFVRVSRTR